jgi:hypothetical protein
VIKRVFLVFTNASMRTGEGLNFDILPVEQARLQMVVARLQTMFPQMGNVVVMAEYPTFAMKTGEFLSQHFYSTVHSTAFVGLRGLIDKLGEAEEQPDLRPDTLVVSCLSFYNGDWSGNDAFYRYFSKWWNANCLLFGMPPITPHPRDGDRSVLVLDHERREVQWITNIGEGAEVSATTLSA